MNRRALLLGSAAALLAAPAAANTPFPSYSFPGLGPTARTMPDRLGDTKNVKDFGAIGNGVANDAAAVQAAINYSTAPYSATNTGTIYFPPGTYNFGATTVNLPTSIRAFRLIGSAGARIIGVNPGALISRPAESPFGGTFGVEFLDFANSHLTGRDLLMHSCVGVSIRNCRFGGHRGIETYNSQAATIDTCVFIRDGGTTLAGSVGILAGNATSVITTDVTGYETGIRHFNLGLLVHGGRYEVNGDAIMLGRDQNNAVFQSTGVSIAGLSMESNNVGLYMDAASAVSVSACAVTVNVPGKADGIYANNVEQVVIQGSSISNNSSFSGAGIRLNNPARTVISACRINVASGAAWNLPADTTKYTVIQCTPAVP